ncbi:MAG: hypothetical protein BJ554DRAFT_3325 [Olpidium bornovanus]|uniref:Uncharacterized protein n=1 Tax=Olpidium bornovanus TaxID=278681 RepID=A0A8H8DLM2_9FUNG|nr:MAG: hypothetical protein BJ554DRAFT_3325 [Olpidium bornovanus]
MFQTPSHSVFPLEVAASPAAGRPQQQQLHNYHQQQQQLQQQYQHQLLLAQGNGSSNAPGQPLLGFAAAPAAAVSPAADRSLLGPEYLHLHHPGTPQHPALQQLRQFQQSIGVAAASPRPNQFALTQQSPATALQVSALEQQHQQPLAFTNGSIAVFPSPGDPLQRLPQSMYAHQARPYGSPDIFAAYPLQDTAPHSPQSLMGLHGPRHVPHQSVSPTKAGAGKAVTGALQPPVYAVGSLRADLQPKPAPFFTGDAAPPNLGKTSQSESFSANPSASAGFSFLEAERPARMLAEDGTSVPIDDDAPPIQPLGSGPHIADDYQNIQSSSVRNGRRLRSPEVLGGADNSGFLL